MKNQLSYYVTGRTRDDVATPTQLDPSPKTDSTDADKKNKSTRVKREHFERIFK